MRSVAIFGSTGSIGKTALEVIKNLEGFRVVALSSHSNMGLLREQIAEFKPKFVCVTEESAAKELAKSDPSLRVFSGESGLEEMAELSDFDTALMAISGMAALKATLSLISSKKRLLLASKEVLVSAGEYIRKMIDEYQIELLPVDSEHSALFQCLMGQKKSDVERLIITATGGPFLNKSSRELRAISVDDALNHPIWRMGKKISVDSSTLMNKGLEVIEAAALFQIPIDKIQVLIHPEAYVHGLLQFVDGTFLASLHEPKMHYPIQFALTYPDRRPSFLKSLDLVQAKFHFYSPDVKKFPLLSLAMEAGRIGKSLPCFLNGANEIIVHRFLKGEISWHEIASKLEKLVSKHQIIPLNSLEAIFAVDSEARRLAEVE